MLEKLAARIADYLTTDDDSEWELVQYSASMLISRLRFFMGVVYFSCCCHISSLLEKNGSKHWQFLRSWE